jgi:FAD/FMN-containing dehydrogenase/Fe-S oxidoreductase
MIPRLGKEAALRPEVRAFIDALAAGGFKGDIRTDLASRLVSATDNSIYQLLPEGVINPRDHDDVVLAMTLLGEPRFREVTVSPRGGGTGTNGQSLTHGLILDLSKYMNRILEVSPERLEARVQPGVVLDQLNDEVRRHGLMFAPTVSTSDRATIGGMIATDAAGKGSLVYGKTSQHVIELSAVLSGGHCWRSRAISKDALAEMKRRKDPVGQLHRVVDEITSMHADEIERVYPKLNRFVSGYNLAKVRGDDGTFNLNYLLCGSEGTLVLTTEAVVRLTPIPKHTQVVVLAYPSFDEALGSARIVAGTQPSAIETMDEHLLDLVKGDEAYLKVAPTMERIGKDAKCVILVEYAGDDAVQVEARVRALSATLDEGLGTPDFPSGYEALPTAREAGAFWTLRKRSVGLLGNLPGRRKPVPFVEDCVVPPEKLREFVRRFRAMLEGHGLRYGMFGHVDAGVLHVRPALDMSQERDAALIRTISDEVAELVKSFGGVLWGEHGKGVRAEFNPMFFGPVITAAMRRVKGAADPRNQLNPGKIASPPDSNRAMLTIEATTRGEHDREIDERLRERFDAAVYCNGNGQCFSDLSDYVMCPSWKGTRDRVHSPKGRATVMREWMRQLSVSARDNDPVWTPESAPRTNALTRAANELRRRGGEYDFSHEVREAMDGCLACKACAGQCPVKVDVPDFRAEFLQAYYDRYPRRVRDHLVGGLESALPRAARVAGLSNLVTGNAVGRGIAARVFGLVDAPKLARPTLERRLAAEVGKAHAEAQRRRETQAQDGIARQGRLLRDLSERSSGERTVVIIQDAFTSFYTPEVVVAAVRVIRALGLDAYVAPYFPSGKSLHVKGFVRRFRMTAEANARTIRELAETGATLIGLDPAVTLMYRDEYVKVLGNGLVKAGGAGEGLPVLMVQEWLVDALPVGDVVPGLSERGTPSQAPTRVRLLGHCTERTMAPRSPSQWTAIFERLGVSCIAVDVGCCGMCGAFGHEAEHAEQSRGIFDGSWGPQLGEAFEGETVTTGYSCRTQAKRFGGVGLRHPVEVVSEVLNQD